MTELDKEVKKKDQPIPLEHSSCSCKGENFGVTLGSLSWSWSIADMSGLGFLSFF